MAPLLEDLLHKKVLIVSGKGGVGKTTVSLALGLLAAEKGRNVILAEIDSEGQVAHLLERKPYGYEETELLPRLRGINIQPKQSFEEYVLMQIKFRGLYRAVFENRLVRRFIDATPGLGDLMCIGKVYELQKRADLVIVDAPATGHGIALLEIAKVVAEAVPGGPLRTEAEKIHQLLLDPERTRAIIVTLPEEMPVTEAVEMRERLRDMKISVGPFLLNQFQEEVFTRTELQELKALGKKLGKHHPAALLIEGHLRRIAGCEEYRSRLEEASRPTPVIPIPFQYTSHFGLTEIQTVAACLEGEGRDEP